MKQLGTFLARMITGPSSLSFQSVAGKAIIATLRNPDEFSPVIEALRIDGIGGSAGVANRNSNVLRLLAQEYRTNASAKGTLEKAVADLNLGMPGSIAELFDGVQALATGPEVIVDAQQPEISGGISHDGKAIALSPAMETASKEDVKPTPPPAKTESAEKSPMDLLSEGQRVYAPEPNHYTIEEKTLDDLEVFNQDHGLYKIVNKTQTEFGAKRLEWLMRNPFMDTAEIYQRQEAVREILRDGDLRGSLETSFKKLKNNADDDMWDHFFSQHGPGVGTFVFANAVGLGIPLIAFGLLSHAKLIAALAPLLLQFVVLFWMTAYQRMADLRPKLLRYKAVFQLARDMSGPLSRSHSRKLQEIGNVFKSVSEKNAPESIAPVANRFFRLKGFGWTAPLDFIYMHSAKTLWGLARTLKKNRERLTRVLGALSELDTYFALAQYAMNQKDGYAFPVVRDGQEAYVRIVEGHHPLLASRGKSVSNSIELGRSSDRANFVVATGSNMGGKSTFLKMAALLPLLAQIGAPVPARSMESTPIEVLTNIDIRDSLAMGKSLYDAETDQILHVIHRAEKSDKLLVVMDEILQGTNPEERTAAERAIVRYLLRTQNIFLLATHNLNISDLAHSEPTLANVHVEEKHAGEKMIFSHKILPGPAVSRNGLLTLEIKKFPEVITQEAREYTVKHSKRDFDK